MARKSPKRKSPAKKDAANPDKVAKTPKRVTTQQAQQKPKQNTEAGAVSQNNKRCPLCEAEHYLPLCPTFRKMDTKARFILAKKIKFCYHCISGVHRVRSCKFNRNKLCKVEGCVRYHHPLLHPDESIPTFFEDIGSTLNESPELNEPKNGSSQEDSSEETNIQDWNPYRWNKIPLGIQMPHKVRGYSLLHDLEFFKQKYSKNTLSFRGENYMDDILKKKTSNCNN